MRRVLKRFYYLRWSDQTRRYVGGTSCPVCCGEYWTRVRVQLHLKFSKRCQALVEACLSSPMTRSRGFMRRT